MDFSELRPLRSVSFPALKGRIRVPGDKSISHRALMLGGTACGETKIHGLLDGEDVIATGRAMVAMGAELYQEGSKTVIRGLGVGSLLQPSSALDLGNSGTSARLLMGLIASNPISVRLFGDASLQSRPMNRVIDPLRLMGAEVEPSLGGKFPLTIRGGDLAPIVYKSPVASAQVKSCLLLAGLNTLGETTVVEPKETRDHSERMLTAFGAEVRCQGPRVTVTGQGELHGCEIVVPGDPSSAAFFAVAAAVTPGSDLVIENVCLNPRRTGFLITLAEMGADISYEDRDVSGGEEVASVRVRHSSLQGLTVPADRAASMIDEYPIMSVAAACAEGQTKFVGLEELRVKESDRLAGIASLMKAAEVPHQLGDDWISITGLDDGRGQAMIKGGGTVATRLDHRMAMATLILGGVTQFRLSVDDANCIRTSFPSFESLLSELGVVFS